jgi:hypothetical protein
MSFVTQAQERKQSWTFSAVRTQVALRNGPCVVSADRCVRNKLIATLLYGTRFASNFADVALTAC